MQASVRAEDNDDNHDDEDDADADDMNIQTDFDHDTDTALAGVLNDISNIINGVALILRIRAKLRQLLYNIEWSHRHKRTFIHSSTLCETSQGSYFPPHTRGKLGESKGNACQSTMCQWITFSFAYVAESMMRFIDSTGSK